MVETCVDCWAVDLGASGADEDEYIEARLAILAACNYALRRKSI